MTTYTTISDALVAVGAKPFATTIQALRDNPLAIAEQDSSVPDTLRLGAWLLGTMTTISGSSATLSGLNLTPYKFLRFSVNNVSTSSTSATLRVDGLQVSEVHGGIAAGVWNGLINIDLSNGVFDSVIGAGSAGNGSGVSNSFYAGRCTYTTASTSVTISISAGSFDLGSIRVYGVK